MPSAAAPAACRRAGLPTAIAKPRSFSRGIALSVVSPRTNIVSSINLTAFGQPCPSARRRCAPRGCLSYLAFLPDQAGEIEEPSARDALSRLTRLPVQTSLSQTPIGSSCVVPRNAGSADGHPLLLLHGFDSSCLEWRRALPELEARGLEPWAVDILGWGFTDHNEAGVASFSVEAKREHLFQFWKQHMNSRPAVIVGASLGGAAAIDLTLAHPEMVAALVLVDAQGYAEGVGDMAAMPQWLARAGVALLKSIPLRQYAGKLSYHDVGLATDDAMRVGRLHTFVPGWADAKLDFMRSGGYNVGSKIPEIQKQTLIVWGAQDRILDPLNAKKFVQDIPGSSLEVLEACGHVPHLEKPAAFAAIIQRFCSRFASQAVPLSL